MSPTKHRKVELTVKVHFEDGMYWAEVEEHPGLFASGETMDELIEAIGEAWALYTHSTRPEPVERCVATQSMSVLVPA
jgi:predicted RNase H-like HicB family nuclease